MEIQPRVHNSAPILPKITGKENKMKNWKIQQGHITTKQQA